MQIMINMAVLSVALLMWTQEASAQSATYKVSVSVHDGLPQLSPDEVKSILDKASKMLQKRNLADPESDSNVKCDVTFTLNGPIGTFSDLPTGIVNKDNIDVVMNSNVDDGSDFHIKVVKGIEFCRPGVDTPQAGCAFSPPHFRSVVVVHPEIHGGLHHLGPDHLLWAHEFGHLTGLPHREGVDEIGAARDDKSALMTRCALRTQFFQIDDAQVQVSRDECRQLLAGPGHRSPGPFKNPPVCRQP
jgi:hypothetical protein